MRGSDRLQRPAISEGHNPCCPIARVSRTTPPRRSFWTAAANPAASVEGLFIKPVDALDLTVLKADAVRSFARLHPTVTRTSAWTQHRRQDSTPPATDRLPNAVSNHFHYARFSPTVVTVLGPQRITFTLKNDDDIGHELIAGSRSNSMTGTVIVRSRAACIL